MLQGATDQADKVAISRGRVAHTANHTLAMLVNGSAPKPLEESYLAGRAAPLHVLPLTCCCSRPASPVNSETSPTRPKSNNLARLLPAPLTGRPKPFHVTVSTPWMDSAAQAPHWLAYRDIPVPPINGMPPPSKREPNKRAGSLLIRRIHRRGTPKFCSSQLDGTQSRGEHRQGSAATSRCLPVASLTLRGRT